MSAPKLPKFSLLEKNNMGSQCDRCGRELLNVYVIKDNETGEVNHYGSGCAEHAMGRTLQEVYLDGVAYKNAVAEYDLEQNSRTRVQQFEQVNAEMWEFICAGEDNSFLREMKKQVEKNGSLTLGQFDAVYCMMLEPAELDDKVQNLELNMIKCKKDVSNFGYYPEYNYTLICETADNKLVRVYFSSMSDKTSDYLSKKGILRINNDGEYEFLTSTLNKISITVSGQYDGYKIKRAKLS